MPTTSRLRFSPVEHQNIFTIAKESDWLPLSMIVVFGAILRWWSPAMRSDLWYDEVYSYNVAGRSFGAMMKILYSGADTNPPLYTVLLHFWLKLAGSDTHVKSFSLLFATAAIGLVYLLAQKMFGRQVAMVSSLLFASSQAVITYSVEARPYATFLFFSLLSTYLLICALQRMGTSEGCSSASKLWAGYAVASALSIYTHWFALLVLLAQATAPVIYRCRSRANLRGYLVSLLAIACCCLPLVVFLRNQIALQNRVGGYSWPGRPGVRSVVNLGAFFTGDKNLLVIAVAILIAAYPIRRKKKLSIASQTRRHIAFLLAYAFIPVLVVLTASTLAADNSFFVNRYFLPFIICVPIGVGLALSRLRHPIRFLLILLFVVAPVCKTLTHWSKPETPYSRTASLLLTQSPAQTLIAHLSPMSYYPVAHYLGSTDATEKIVCGGENGSYEIDYNLLGGMLTSDELIEVGVAMHEYGDIWLIIEPMDRDKRLVDLYQDFRDYPEFFLESQKRIDGLRLEHYRSRVSEGTGLAQALSSEGDSR